MINIQITLCWYIKGSVLRDCWYTRPTAKSKIKLVCSSWGSVWLHSDCRDKGIMKSVGIQRIKIMSEVLPEMYCDFAPDCVNRKINVNEWNCIL